MFDYARPFAVFFGILVVVYLLSKLCYWKRNVEAQAQAQVQAQVQAQAQAGVRGQAQEEHRVERKGLEQEIIDSYPTVVMGEKGNKVELDDATCSICLSEYDKSDVLKILPECLHRFHRDCLDEWLKRDDTCPICRTHPPRF